MRTTPATYPAAATLLVLLVLTIAGCGSGDDPARPADGALTVYSSLPQRGVLAEEGRAAAAGQRLALEDAGRRAGDRRVRLVQLDSAGDGDAPWDPAAIESNAKRAVDDPTAIAYLGELALGGSAVSVPVTNSERLLQVSPADGLPSLTQPAPGGGGEGPARYYPEGARTFLRIVPHGGLEASVLVDWARERGARSLAIVRDEGPFGQELTSWILDVAQRLRVPVEAERVPQDEDDYADLAADVAEERPGAVLVAMEAGEDATGVAAALRRALPSVPLLGTSGLAGGAPSGLDFVSPYLPADEYGGGARKLLDRLERTPGVAALYGYESMRLVLDAIGRARPGAEGAREAVTRAALGARRVNGAFGPYAVVPGGDVSTSVFGAYRAGAGPGARPRPLGVRSAETAPPP
jgi:branched-chain amino acid transport system substrate-binding protein